jgi:hypothetical protein
MLIEALTTRSRMKMDGAVHHIEKIMGAGECPPGINGCHYEVDVRLSIDKKDRVIVCADCSATQLTTSFLRRRPV